MKYHIKGRLEVTYKDIRNTYEYVDREIDADSKEEALDLAIQQIEEEDYGMYDEVESDWFRTPVITEIEETEEEKSRKIHRSMVSSGMPTLPGCEEVQA